MTLSQSSGAGEGRETGSPLTLFAVSRELPPGCVEVWRVSYAREAYVDQTGRAQSGYVVHDAIILRETGERFMVDDGYGKHPDHGRYYRDGDGLIWKGWTETLDYSGGFHLSPPDEKRIEGSSWIRAPYSAKGYAYPDGSAPVRHLFESPEERLNRLQRERDAKQG